MANLNKPLENDIGVYRVHKYVYKCMHIIYYT